jgi:hypothetical protein
MRTREKYSFREGSHLAVKKAAGAGRELARIAGKHGGLTAERVVDEAKDDNSPLHDFFTWSNKDAAKKYRLEQARHLIRSVVVEYEEPTKAGPMKCYIAFEKSESDAADDPRYLSLHTVLTDGELRKRLLVQAMAEFQSWKRRYYNLEELADIFKAGDGLRIVKTAKTPKGAKAAKRKEAEIVITTEAVKAAKKQARDRRRRKA